MSASNICCTHEQLRIDSPEPPSRPLATIDGIFAAAVLPEGHPHALQFPGRKPETDRDIVQSPSVTDKIKLQFRRKSVKNLKKEEAYDHDARQMTLQEVLNDIEDTPARLDAKGHNVQPHDRFGSVLELDKLEITGPEAIQSDVRTSVFKSLGYLQPLLQRSSESRASDGPQGLVDLETCAGTGPELVHTANGQDVRGRILPKSTSSPVLLLGGREHHAPLPRPRSQYDLGHTISVPKHRIEASRQDNCGRREESIVGAGAEPSSVMKALIPTPQVQEQTTTDDVSDSTPRADLTSDQCLEEDHDIHLHKMKISQQLRSMSQMSEGPGSEALMYPSQTWSFHCRERSGNDDPSSRNRRSRLISSSGIDSTTVPSSWGRVRSPIRNTPSSIYSWPVSPNVNAEELHLTDHSMFPPNNLPDLKSLFADWPLPLLTSAEEPTVTSAACSDLTTGAEKLNKPLPPTPVGSRKDTGSVSFATATDDTETSSVKFLPLPRRPTPIPSKSSSSTLTKTSKQSKFLERLSPPKKTVRKRMSVFKFLRPGSWRQQARSVSSPMLKCTNSTHAYDGQSEDAALLTVQYELTANPSHITRSVSMGQLHPSSQEPEDCFISSSILERQPTLADYERNLSAAGDDRRRPSAIDIQRVKEIQEDDRRESVALRRKLSRARPLKDDASPLMAQALEKHQQEKALFRSASKQRDSMKETPLAQTFSSSPLARTGTSLPPPSLTNHNDLLDPLEKGQLLSPSSHGTGTGSLLSPPVRASGSPQWTSSAASSGPPSTRASLAGPVRRTLPQGQRRIGTSLESWSRYPSHTREERCGSAGNVDNVIARDFAVDVNPEEIRSSEETGTRSPIKKKMFDKSPVQHSKSAMPTSRSITFGGIVRYYSNLFQTRGWHGQNRRTSVTIGGRLEYPELEMLPPQMPTEAVGSHRPSEFLKRFEEHVKEDADKLKQYLKEEESKLEDYVRKEEGMLEEFVKTEEHKLEEFVNKEEGKLMQIVIEEEDKLMHPHHRLESGGPSTHRKGSPFRSGSIFEVAHTSPDHSSRKDTLVDPNEDLITGKEKAAENKTDSSLGLDGSGANPDETKTPTVSKASIWSELYQECLAHPSDKELRPPIQSIPPTAGQEAHTMPPPALKPVKPRRPERPGPYDPKSAIRRFPSVTVIDDRKGHYRSISLFSVKTSKSANFERSSTQDLVELIQKRE